VVRVLVVGRRGWSEPKGHQGGQGLGGRTSWVVRAGRPVQFQRVSFKYMPLRFSSSSDSDMPTV